MNTQNVYQTDLYAETLKPLDEASPLPWWCYSSPEWHQKELKALFRGPGSEWLCVGRTEQLPKVGDFLQVSIADYPVIVTRDKDRQINVLSGVCRHRGTQLTTEEEGNCRAFVCPYHHWTYSLEGKLAAIPAIPGQAPPMGQCKHFDTADYGLTPIKFDVWKGFIFITFAENPQPLATWLEPLARFTENYQLENIRFARRDKYSAASNWKVFMENGFENYHTPIVHRPHIDFSKPAPTTTFVDSDGPYEALFISGSVVFYEGLPPISPALNEKERSGVYHLWVQPNLHLVLSPSYVRYRMMLPTSVEAFEMIECWAFSEEALKHPDFQEIFMANYHAPQQEIAHEDLAIVPQIQKGLRSGAFVDGRYSTEERLVHDIAKYVIGRVADQ